VCFHLPLVRSGLSRAIFFVAARISSLQRRFRCRLIFPRLDLFSRSWFVFSISFAAGLFFWFLPLSKLRLFLPPSRFRSAAGQAFDLRLVFTPPISSRVRFRSRAGPRATWFALGRVVSLGSLSPVAATSLDLRSGCRAWRRSSSLLLSPVGPSTATRLGSSLGLAHSPPPALSYFSCRAQNSFATRFFLSGFSPSGLGLLWSGEPSQGSFIHRVRSSLFRSSSSWFGFPSLCR
jgi:hypothetical protein